VKVGNPAVRRIFARVCRDTIARCLKFEDQLQANLDQGLNGKGAKIKKLIEDKVRRNLPNEEIKERGLDQKREIRELITLLSFLNKTPPYYPLF